MGSALSWCGFFLWGIDTRDVTLLAKCLTSAKAIAMNNMYNIIESGEGGGSCFDGYLNREVRECFENQTLIVC